MARPGDPGRRGVDGMSYQVQVLEVRRVRPTNEWDRREEVVICRVSYFCPACGKQDMWQEGGAGNDYYHDATAECASCQHVMCCVPSVEAPK